MQRCRHARVVRRSQATHTRTHTHRGTAGGDESSFAGFIAASVFICFVVVRTTYRQDWQLIRNLDRISRRRPTFSGKYLPAAKVWQINFAIELPMMRDRLESEHVFFLDLCASVIRSIRLFVRAPTSGRFFFLAYASGHVRLTPFPELSWRRLENFLADKKSSHSNARWKFGSDFLPSCGNEQLPSTRAVSARRKRLFLFSENLLY